MPVPVIADEPDVPDDHRSDGDGADDGDEEKECDVHGSYYSIVNILPRVADVPLSIDILPT